MKFDFDFLKLPLFVAMLLIIVMLGWKLDAKVAEHDAYVARVEAAAAVAEANKAATEAKQDNNLQTIEEKHDEKHVEAVRAAAVRVVRNRVQHDAGSGGMPGIAASQPAYDDGAEECRAALVIVANAAEDADTLTMWQEWARANNIPVKP